MDRLAESSSVAFSVVVVQRNGMLHSNREVCRLQVSCPCPKSLQWPGEPVAPVTCTLA